MTRDEFAHYLSIRNYHYGIANDCLEIFHQGGVDLQSLTAMPEGVQFNNHGWAYLSSLTAMPEGVQFNNQGSVDLSSLTAMPEGVQFNNQGSVDLSSLIKPEQFYSGAKRSFRHVDGLTMIVERRRNRGDVTIYTARYFGGGPIEDMQRCYVAERGDVTAHGDTPRQAVRDLTFKEMASAFDRGHLIDEIKARGEISFNEFRLITGACESGLRYGLEQLGYPGDTESLPLSTALKLVKGQYGAAEMQDAFGKEN